MSGRATPKTVHWLKVTLEDVEPPVWRQVEVRSTTKLVQLAAELEAAMGWIGGHLHAFETPKARYGEPDLDWASDDLDERKYSVVDALPTPGSTMVWSYDFGDGWEHGVVVEAIEPVARGASYPRCTGGQRACPPEDCGGAWGYQNLLEAIGDPAHEDHDDLVEWLGDDFDPEAFDSDEATDAMQSSRPLAGW